MSGSQPPSTTATGAPRLSVGGVPPGMAVSQQGQGSSGGPGIGPAAGMSQSNLNGIVSIL